MLSDVTTKQPSGATQSTQCRVAGLACNRISCHYGGDNVSAAHGQFNQHWRSSALALVQLVFKHTLPLLLRGILQPAPLCLSPTHAHARKLRDSKHLGS